MYPQVHLLPPYHCQTHLCVFSIVRPPCFIWSLPFRLMIKKVFPGRKQTWLWGSSFLFFEDCAVFQILNTVASPVLPDLIQWERYPVSCLSWTEVEITHIIHFHCPFLEIIFLITFWNTMWIWILKSLYFL